MARRAAMAGLAAGAVAPRGLSAQGSARAARIVVGFTPGGPSDVVARLLAEALRGGFAPQAFVENRTGAGWRWRARLRMARPSCRLRRAC